MVIKNVADYTDFEGKTNKKIVQPPGGTSSFSLAWSDEKTDYGPQRFLKKKDSHQNYNETQQFQNTPKYQKQQNFNYNEPIRLIQDKSPEQYSIPHKQQTRQMNSIQLIKQGQGSKQYGGQYGYSYNAPKETRQNKQSYQHGQVDRRLQEEQKNRNSIPSNFPGLPENSNFKPSIKIQQQKSSIVLGDNYNYWQENSKDLKKSNQLKGPSPLYENPTAHYEQKPQQSYTEKTSAKEIPVKVRNPPGGKSSITFG